MLNPLRHTSLLLLACIANALQHASARLAVHVAVVLAATSTMTSQLMMISSP
jgi:hypothetical protein